MLSIFMVLSCIYEGLLGFLETRIIFAVRTTTLLPFLFSGCMPFAVLEKCNTWFTFLTEILLGSLYSFRDIWP